MAALAVEDYRGMTFVNRALVLLISTFLRDMNGSKILGTDYADGAHRPKVRFAPGDSCANRLCAIAFAVCSGDQRTAQFGHAFDRWHDIALIIGESHLASKIARFPFLDHPIA